MRPILTSALLAALAAPLPALAETKGAFVRDRAEEAEHKPVPRDESLLEPYIAANIIETIYHELGHAVIAAMDLPVYGNEEIAADVFAIVLMNRLLEPSDAHAMSHEVARAYWLAAEATGKDRSDLDLWDIHGTDLQRYYTLTCLMYGADTEAREDLVDLSELPHERRRGCADEFRVAEASWGAVLDELATDAPGDDLVLDWTVEDAPDLTAFVELEIARINAALSFPQRINVSVIPCGQSNAFYDPGYDEILICTELPDGLSDLLRHE